MIEFCVPLYNMKTKKQKVALVLSSGGARGYAHIGAIEELEANGFEITSIAGCSMGALIGGMYAAGRLEEVGNWMKSLDARKLFSLLDISFSMSHIINVEPVLEAMRQIVPDTNIENLELPYCAVASDVKNFCEVVMREGSLYDAIRASISVPSMFKPVKRDGMLLVDGGLTNPLPLNRVERCEGDLLVAVNVSAPNEKVVEGLRQRARGIYMQNHSFIRRLFAGSSTSVGNYYSLISNSFSLMIQQNARQRIELTPPDILVNIPMNRLKSSDYRNAEKVIRFGKARMRDALREYAARQG